MGAIQKEQEENPAAAGLVPAELCHGIMQMQEIDMGSKGDRTDN